MNATVFSILKAKLLWEVVFPTRPSAVRCEARCCLCRLRGRGQHHSASRLVPPRHVPCCPAQFAGVGQRNESSK